MKNLKRLTAVLAVSALCVGTAFTSFAAEATNPSPAAPVIGNQNSVDGESSPVSLGGTTDKDGNSVFTYADPITDPTVNDTLKDEEAVKDVLEEAGFVVPNDPEVKVEVLAAADIQILGAMPNGGVDVKFVLVDDGITKKGQTLYVLHYIPEKGIWEVMEAVVDMVDGELCISAHFDSLSPVAIVRVMKNNEVLKLDRAEPRKSPRTGM